MIDHLKDRKIVLLSGSPRRQQILKEAGFEFTIQKPGVDEDFPSSMPVRDVAAYLARKKAMEFRQKISTEIAIAADTTVVLEDTILNKPADREDAIRMLSLLSGKTHTVITGVCLLSCDKEVHFDDRTEVSFKPLTSAEITYYIDRCGPYDKAGAYGVQDWIGMIGIEKIVGSYFTVVGLPIHKVYHHLCDW